MPGEDGLSLARYLRANTKIGIIMLTAAGEVVDRIVGLEMGADDYLPSRSTCASCWRASAPCCGGCETAPGEAGGRAAGHATDRLRRAASSTSTPTGCSTPPARRCRSPAWSSTCSRRSPSIPTGCSRRDQLLDLAHNRDWEPFDRSIDIRIARLRRKVETDPSKPQVIKTVRGAGYIFVPDGEEPARL